MNPITIDNLSKIEDATHLMEILLPLGYEVIIKRYNIDCHCGLSFGASRLPEYYKPKKVYYIGFDCGHICDGHDYNLALKHGLLTEKRFNELMEMEIRLPTFLQPVRSVEYVEEQCKKIVDQLEVEE